MNSWIALAFCFYGPTLLISVGIDGCLHRLYPSYIRDYGTDFVEQLAICALFKIEGIRRYSFLFSDGSKLIRNLRTNDPFIGVPSIAILYWMQIRV